jgi:hypothetical protein
MDDKILDFACFGVAFQQYLFAITTIMLIETAVIFLLIARSWFHVRNGRFNETATLVYPVFFWYMAAIILSVFVRSFVLAYVGKS